MQMTGSDGKCKPTLLFHADTGAENKSNLKRWEKKGWTTLSFSRYEVAPCDYTYTFVIFWSLQVLQYPDHGYSLGVLKQIQPPLSSQLSKKLSSYIKWRSKINFNVFNQSWVLLKVLAVACLSPEDFTLNVWELSVRQTTFTVGTCCMVSGSCACKGGAQQYNRMLFHLLAGGKIPKGTFVFLNKWTQWITQDGGLTVMAMTQTLFGDSSLSEVLVILKHLWLISIPSIFRSKRWSVLSILIRIDHRIAYHCSPSGEVRFTQCRVVH